MLKQIVEAIQNSEKYLPCNTIIYRMGDKLERIYYTEGLPQMCGYTPDEYSRLSTDNAFDNVYYQDRSIVEKNVRECLGNGIERNFLYRIKHKTRGYIWVHAISKLIWNNENESVFTANLSNVTNQMMTTDAILNATDRGVVVLDKQTHDVLFANPKFLTIAETTSGECIGKPCNEVICKMGVFDREKCICLEMENSGQDIVVPGKYNRFYSMSCKSIMLGEHEALAYFLYDVTENYNISKELEMKNLERKDMIDALNQTNEMILIADWNTREILYLNKAASELNDGIISDLIGKKCSQIVMASDMRCPYCFKDELTKDDLLIKELKVKNMYFKAKGKRIKWNGRDAFIEYVSNVTAERNMTEEVVRDRNMLTSAIRTLFPLGIITNLSKNEYSMFEYDDFSTTKAASSGVFDELIEVGASTIHEDERAQFVEKFSRNSLLQAYSNGERVVSLIHRQLSDHGEWHWIRTLVVMSEVLYEGDLFSITLSENVDKQKQAELEMKAAMDAAKKADQAKTAFLARMSHELRTPLNAISGYAHLLDEKCRKNPVGLKNIKTDVSAIQNAEKYLSSIINRVLNMQQIEAGKIEIVKDVYYAQDYLKRITEMIQLEAEKKNICFTVERLSKRNEYYYADGDHIEQIILLMLENAIKFTPEGGMVTLEMKTIKEEGRNRVLQIRVMDTGIGMSEDFVRKKLFCLFNQENDTSTTPYSGVGISMAYAKQLAIKMGGDLVCESVKGKGTIFTLTVTVEAVSDEEAGIKQSGVLTQEMDFTGVRVLLCEDNIVNQKIMKKILESKNCIVDVAENGKVGFDMYRNSRENYYYIILMDIRMPEMNGYNATRAIRALERPDAKEIPIYAVSANSYEADVKMAIESGMNGHIAKPVEPSKLYDVLDECIHTIKLAKTKILIVDDAEINRDVFIATLGLHYQIIEAENGREAYQSLLENPDIKAVITDIQMPVMSGVELIRKMKSNSQLKDIIIIANTQLGDCPEEEELISLGIDDFIYKPTSPNVIELRIRNALRKINQ